MAKRRLAETHQRGRRSPPTSERRRFGLEPTAAALLGGVVVYVLYYPSDSVSVERGDALLLGLFALTLVVLTSVLAWGDRKGQRFHGDEDTEVASASMSKTRLALHVLRAAPWVLAAWMMVAAWATSPPGNLRMATNEGWLWVTGAALFTSSRRLLASPRVRETMIVLIVAGATGLSVLGLYQQWVSLPANREAYRNDPDRVVQMAGIDAPAGSTERMIFENRLFDGGPTGTFALANSLAGVLVFAVVLAAGTLHRWWRCYSWTGRSAWIAAITLCALCLIATRSRAAVGATVIGLAMSLTWSTVRRQSIRRVVVLGSIGLVSLLLAGSFAVGALGNREWVEQAPASLAFRLQYWRSTWQLVSDRPLFGSGPGNFQSAYESYRDASATEQIAEPHNLFFETLAGGGFPALLILLALLAAGLIVYARSESIDSSSSTTAGLDRTVWVGAIASLSLIGLVGWASRTLPDVEATVVALPVAVVLGRLMVRSGDDDGEQSIVAPAAAPAMAAIGVHLMVSGGWTVPGVAICVWIGAAMLTASRPRGPGRSESDRWSGVKDRRPIAWTTLCVLMLLMLYAVSYRPVTGSKRLMTQAALAQSIGQLERSRTMLERAITSDRWSTDAALWLADHYRWRLVSAGDGATSRWRQPWEMAVERVKERAGSDPAVYRMLGAQQMHVYQRHGLEPDLRRAAGTFGEASKWSPSSEWLAAQAAVMASARGDQATARRLSRRARHLSQLGGNIERDLSRKLIYLPEHLGNGVIGGPARRSADQLLPEPIGGS